MYTEPVEDERGPEASESKRSLPYKVIVTDCLEQTLGEGRIRHYRTMIAAATAFAKHPAPFKQVIYDDGHLVRWLTDDEQALLEHVCGMLGYDVEDVA